MPTTNMASPAGINHKPEATTVEDFGDDTKVSQPEVEVHEVDSALEKETLGRLDMVLVPLMIMLYLLAWLDRANVGNARVVR